MFATCMNHVMNHYGAKIYTCASIIGMILACNITTPVRAQVILSPYNSYPQRECRGLSAMDAVQLKILATTHNPFWIGGERQQQAYLAAFHGGEYGVRRFQKSNGINIADKAAIVLASIAKRNITMLQDNYDGAVDDFFMKQMKNNVLYWAAMCNFYDGVKFLLLHDVDPNTPYTGGHGPFNVTLLYPHSKIPQILVEHNYSISRNYEWCKSSKYVLRLYADRIDSAVAAKIRESACVAPR